MVKPCEATDSAVFLAFPKTSEPGRRFCFCSRCYFSEKLASEVVTKRPNHSLFFKGSLNYLCTVCNELWINTIFLKNINRRICETTGSAVDKMRQGTETSVPINQSRRHSIWGGDYLENRLSCPVHLQCLFNEPLLWTFLKNLLACH